jgi:hypothetical protein
MVEAGNHARGTAVADAFRSEGIMKNSLLGLALLAASASTAFAGDELAVSNEPKTAQNALYAELGGNSGWYSLNYERFLKPEMAVRVGLSYMSVTATAGNGTDSASANATWATLPIMFE